MKSSRIPHACTTVLLGLFVFVAGCSRSTTGTVVGKVSHKGKVVKGGTVTLVSAAGLKLQARIKPDGSYRASLPFGETKVGVQITEAAAVPPIVAPRLPAKPEQEEGVTIPALYKDPEKSPLRCQVSGGEQIFNIDVP